MEYTGCALTTGFDLDCRDAVGGVKSVRLAGLQEYEALSATIVDGAVTVTVHTNCLSAAVTDPQEVV